MEVSSGKKSYQASYCRSGDSRYLVLAGDGAGNSQALVLAQTLIGEKEESLVLLDGAAKSSAEFVALERGLGVRRGVEEVTSIKIVVANELKGLAVIRIGSGTGRHVDDSAGVSPILCREGRVIDLEFRKRVNRRLKGNLVLHRVVQIDAIHQPIRSVLALACGIDAERALSAQRS